LKAVFLDSLGGEDENEDDEDKIEKERAFEERRKQKNLRNEENRKRNRDQREKEAAALEMYMPINQRGSNGNKRVPLRASSSGDKKNDRRLQNPPSQSPTYRSSPENQFPQPVGLNIVIFRIYFLITFIHRRTSDRSWKNRNLKKILPF
jgi:hypothetical protein